MQWQACLKGSLRRLKWQKSRPLFQGPDRVLIYLSPFHIHVGMFFLFIFWKVLFLVLPINSYRSLKWSVIKMLNNLEKEDKRKWFYKQEQDDVRLWYWSPFPGQDLAAFLLIHFLTGERPQRTTGYALRLSDRSETDSNTETHQSER